MIFHIIYKHIACVSSYCLVPLMLLAHSSVSPRMCSPTTQARRHAGTQALRHAGTQARRHAGTQAHRHAGHASKAFTHSDT